ncbi:MAG: Fic family protein [bacterium]|nr:Fic family protein [bacterium]
MPPETPILDRSQNLKKPGVGDFFKRILGGGKETPAATEAQIKKFCDLPPNKQKEYADLYLSTQYNRPAEDLVIFDILEEEILTQKFSADTLSKLFVSYHWHLTDQTSKPNKQHRKELIARIATDISNETGTQSGDKQTQRSAEIIADKMINNTKSLDTAKWNEQTSNVYRFLEAKTREDKQTFINSPHENLDKEDIEKIIAAHPLDYKEVTPAYQEAKAYAQALEAAGYTRCAKDIRNFWSSDSRIDGTPYENPTDRIAQAKKILSATGLEKEAYQCYENNSGMEYVSSRLIPEAIQNNMPIEELVKNIHCFTAMGSFDLPVEGGHFNSSVIGKYREGGAGINNYMAPDKIVVPEMMHQFSTQLEVFSRQIEELKKGKDFEEKVYQYAAYVLHTFTSIHPMVDGNGRISRALYEYTVAKHLGTQKKPIIDMPIKRFQGYVNQQRGWEYKQYPLGKKMDGQPGFGIIDFAHHHAYLKALLQQTDINETVFEDEDTKKLSSMITRNIEEGDAFKTGYAY